MRRLTGSGGGSAALLCTADAFAHGFGERYELPLPLVLFLSGSGLVVLASFAAMAVFLRSGSDWRGCRSRELRFLASRPARRALEWAGVLAYVLVITAGLLGEQRALKNIAPVLVWALAWVGLAYAAALIGNVWALVNPFDTLFKWSGVKAGGRAYPVALGQWPAVVLFAGFIWLELISPSSDSPRALALLLIGYSLVTWAGMLVYGREAWLAHGEVFNVVYGYLARFAPFEGLRLRPYAVGLLAQEPLGRSQIVLVIMILAAVSFDGFLETPGWAHIAQHFGADTPLVRTAGLAVGVLVIIAAYLATCAAIVRLGGGTAPGRAAGLFVLTLVPIAIAYHVAHYLSFFLMSTQYLVPIASDPLGLGWDLFGGGTRFIRPVVIDARAVWYISVAAIVVAHVVAVVLGHVLALREFATRRDAVRSQWPMVALMTGYTMTSLWIIAQPIVMPAR